MKYRRVVVTRHGGPDVLRTVEEDLPEPKPGEVRVKVEAAGVSGPLSTYLPFGDGELNLVVDPNRAGRNEIHMYVLTPGGLPALVTGEATLELWPPDAESGPIVREPLVAGPGHFVHSGNELAFPGEWRIVVKVRESAFEETVGETTVRVFG